MTTNERISDIELGERLRRSREDAKKTQADAALVIGAARTTIVAIEQGQRRVKLDELQKLARAYDTSVNALLRREAVLLDLVPRFRKLNATSDDAIEKASRLLNGLARAEVELENVLGIERLLSYPPERPIFPGDVRLQAEQDAQQLRDWLGIGPAPILDILSLLERQLGIRVYVRPLDGKISGLFAFDELAGACMLLNANHPADRLRLSAAHELAHFVSARRKPEVLVDGQAFESREERYAVAFAAAFQMPARAVQQQFADLAAGQTHLTRRLIILLAHVFGVSRKAMVLRLEELELTKKGAWAWFESNGGISDAQAREVLGELPEKHGHLHAMSLLPPRLTMLTRTAWKQGFYSEGQLSRLLHLDRHEVREVLLGVELEESEASDSVKLLH
jgi:Zn-dependent peptidase ImmA (M78 family)